MASRSPLAILAIRTSSEVVGIGRAIDSSIRQPGVAQVQAKWKKLRAARPGAGRIRQVSPFKRSWASLTAGTGHFAGHFEGFPAGPRRAGSTWQGTAPISPAEKTA
jgi:hypothetical protein